MNMLKFNGKDGEEVKNITYYNLAFEDITNSTTTADGTTVLLKVATKAKISVSWKMLNNADLSNISKKINSNDKIRLGYYDYRFASFSDGYFYVDNRSASVALFDEKGEPIWEEFTLTFKEA